MDKEKKVGVLHDPEGAWYFWVDEDSERWADGIIDVWEYDPGGSCEAYERAWGSAPSEIADGVLYGDPKEGDSELVAAAKRAERDGTLRHWEWIEYSKTARRSRA